MQHAAEWVFECCNIIAIMLLCYIQCMAVCLIGTYIAINMTTLSYGLKRNIIHNVLCFFYS